jgi:hypothetical protein
MTAEVPAELAAMWRSVISTGPKRRQNPSGQPLMIAAMTSPKAALRSASQLCRHSLPMTFRGTPSHRAAAS